MPRTQIPAMRPSPMNGTLDKELVAHRPRADLIWINPERVSGAPCFLGRACLSSTCGITWKVESRYRSSWRDFRASPASKQLACWRWPFNGFWTAFRTRENSSGPQFGLAAQAIVVRS